MCGFVTLINCNYSLTEKKNIFNKLKKINNHRGPDNIKDYHTKNESVLFKRLKILDLSENSNQPFFNNNKKIFLVFNGEIYNYLELKDELKLKNITFKTKSDTEVIIKLYECYGIDFVKKLRGMFSIIIFDKIKNKTFFFRDRLGQKPLHYFKHRNGLIFSSEIKDIINICNVQFSENTKTVEKFLLRGWRDVDNNTFYKNIFQVPPASYGEIENSNIKFVKKYWELEVSGQKKFNSEEFVNKFNENINLHLRSDVPLAFCLSGGMDSGSITQSALEFNLSNHKAYSLYSQNENDERNDIEKIIHEKNLNHEFVNVDLQRSSSIIEEVNFAIDGPTNYPSHLYQYILRKK